MRTEWQCESNHSWNKIHLEHEKGLSNNCPVCNEQPVIEISRPIIVDLPFFVIEPASFHDKYTNKINRDGMFFLSVRDAGMNVVLRTSHPASWGEMQNVLNTIKDWNIAKIEKYFSLKKL